MTCLSRRWSCLAILVLASLLALPTSGTIAQEDATPVATPPPPPEAPAEGESKTIDAIRERGKIRFGVAVAPPWLLQDPTTGDYFGPSIMVGERIAEILGVEVEYVDSGWDVLIAGLQADKYDIIIAPTFATPARMEVIDFVNYTEAGTCYFVLKDNEKVNTLEDLNSEDVTIVTFTGTGTEEGIKKKYPKARIRSIVQPPGGQPPIEEVLAGRADVGPFDAPLALFLAQQYPQLKIIPESPEYCITHSDIPFPVGMGFRKGDPVLTEFLEGVVASMKPEIDAAIVEFSDPQYMAPVED